MTVYWVSPPSPGAFVRTLRRNAIHPRASPVTGSFGCIACHRCSAETQCGGYLNRATSRTSARSRRQMVATDWRKVPTSRLPQCRTVVRRNYDRVATRSSSQRGSPGAQVRCVRTLYRDLGPVAAREARKFIDAQPALTDFGERQTAVEHVLGKPTPRALPEAVGIDGECIECHDERSEATVGRIRLRVKLFGQREIPRHSVGCHGFGKELAAFLGCECDRSVWKRALVVCLGHDILLYFARISPQSTRRVHFGLRRCAHATLRAESRQPASNIRNEGACDRGCRPEPALNLMAATCPESRPFTEVLTVVCQQAVAVFAEPGASAAHNVLLVECWRASALNVNRAAVREALQGDLLDGTRPKVSSQTRVVQYRPLASIDAMVRVTTPRGDEMGANGWLLRLSALAHVATRRRSGLRILRNRHTRDPSSGVELPGSWCPPPWPADEVARFAPSEGQLQGSQLQR